MLPRIAFGLLSAAFVLFNLNAQPSSPAANEHAQLLTVKVLDAATGQPIAGAQVSHEHGRERATTSTNSEGAAEINIIIPSPAAHQMIQFGVSITARGYGTRVKSWFASAGRVLDTLPRACEVRLRRSITLAGVVQDAGGRPVPGARVEFYGSGHQGGKLGGNHRTEQEYPSISVHGDEAPVTDEQGRWTWNDLPADLPELTLTVTRPGGAQAHFMAGSAPDLSWRPGRRVDFEALKSGRAVLALKEGFTIRGRVVDEAGRPLTGVTLRARDAATTNQAHVFATDFEGRFELQHWDAANVLISAEKDGHRGTTVTIPTGSDAPEAKIVLRPGQPLRLRVVDEQGKPIPGAEISTDPNPSEQIVTWKAETDAEGLAVWSGAPDAPVKYRIDAKTHGFRTAKLLADGSEHVIRFRPGAEHAIHVRVHGVDAKTGQPVPGFEVWRRMPRPTGFKPWGEASQTGEFSGEIKREEFTKGIVESYRLEVRVPGYDVWGSETLHFSNGDQDIVVKLTKGGSALSEVPSPDRRPGEGQDGNSDPALLALGLHVARLLETGDVEAFVQVACATTNDWEAILPPGADASKAPWRRDNGRSLERDRKAVKASAERLLAVAHRAGIQPGSMRFTVNSITNPRNTHTVLRLGGEPVQVPTARSIQLVLAGEPAGTATKRENFRGEYHLHIGTTPKLPAGWKCEEGVRWRALPADIGDETLVNELRLLNRVSEGVLGETRSLSIADDPALAAFGATVVTLLRTRDVPAFIGAVGLARTGLPVRSPDEFETRLTTSLRNLLALPGRVGVDFASPETKVIRVAAGSVRGREFGSIDLLSARSLEVVFEVHGGQTATGRAWAGRYAVSFADSVRHNGQWFVGNPQVRWQTLPAGLLTAEDQQKLELENYVAEHRKLPSGHPAPDIELVRLADNARVPLSAYRDKVVILEFWATWCGPCQEPMAKLQELVQAHPEWKDRVEVITVSIDSKPGKASTHLDSKGWIHTTNFWAGQGEFRAAPPVAFRVQGVPTSYVIGPDGKIVSGGHPASMDFATLVGQQLR